MERSPTAATTTRRSSVPGFVLGLTKTVILLFLILSVIILIAWLVLNPHGPGFRVSSLSVSNFTASGASHLRGSYEIELNITNPNKKIQVMVDHFIVSVHYGSAQLSRAAVQGAIYLEKMNHKDLTVKLRDSPNDVLVVPKNLVKDCNKGMVNFNVKIKARTRFESRIWPSREKFLDVHCDDLEVELFPSKDTGKLLVGIGKDCNVNV